MLLHIFVSTHGAKNKKTLFHMHYLKNSMHVRPWRNNVIERIKRMLVYVLGYVCLVWSAHKHACYIEEIIKTKKQSRTDSHPHQEMWPHTHYNTGN